MGGEQSPIRVGILCEGSGFAAWQADCIRKVQQLEGPEISLLVVNREPPAPRPSFGARLRRNLASGRLLWRAYERLVLNPKAASLQSVNLDEELQDVPRLECIPVRQGKFRQSFDAATIEALRSHEVDVLLRFGFGILTGDILSVAKHGLWSYHHGDPTAFRGAPPGFWEIHQQSPVTGVVLQRLTETLDGGIVLQAGWFKTLASSYSASLDQILFGASHFVASALRDLARDPGRISAKGPIEQPGPVFRYPRNRAMLRFFARTLGARLRDQYASLFRHQQWTLGIIDASVEKIAAQPASRRDIRWLPEAKGKFLADPFTLRGPTDPDTLIVLAEEFDWRSDRGHISAIRWPFGDRPQTEEIIRTGHHFSYPYLIEHCGEIYCIPECAESGKVALYRWGGPTKAWVKDKDLIEGFPVLDPTVFEHEGRWWMFGTHAQGGPNDRLFAWHAPDLRGQWQPHAANPLKLDIRGARPAGRPFYQDGQLIRPAQDCSRHYGGGVVFNRVVKLTIDEFEEERRGILRPDPKGQYPAGLHTINAIGDQTIVDGARWAFVPSEMRRALGRKVGRRMRS